MKTLLIAGNTPVPATLRALVTHGSTSLEEHRADEISGTLPHEVDRVVLWAATADPAMTTLVAAFARREQRQGREVVVYVASDDTFAIEGLSPHEMYVWPRDEDRLKMAFLTGA